MIHQTAQVHPEAQLDPSVEVGPWSIIGPHVKIGKNTKLISNVIIQGWTTIGESNTIYPYAVLGNPPQDLNYAGEKTELIIGNNNIMRESVTLNLGTKKGGAVTRLGNNNLLMAYVHLGHDCDVGNNNVIANYGGFAGHVHLGDYSIINGMVGISQHVRVGSYTYIGGQSGLERDVPPYSIALGSRPCSLKGANIVGLRRRGFNSETIRVINEAIKLWTREDVQKEQCLLEIESQYGELPEIKNFLKFIRESSIGVVR